MDFHKLVSKLKEIEPTNVFNPQGKATEAKPVQRVALSEDAQMRVLAGVSNVLEEGRRISDRQEIVEAKKKNEYAIGMAAAKKQAGMSDKPATGLPKKVVKKGHEIAKAVKRDESVDVDVDALIEDEESSEFKKKFNAMVEAKKEKADKKKKEKEMAEAVTLKPGAKERLEKEKQDRAAADKRRAEAPPVSLKKKPMGEASKPDANKDGIPDYAQDGKGANDLGKGAVPKKKKPADKKGMSAAQERYFGKKNESKMMPKGKKRPVKESVEQKLSFVDCLKIVKESGGQQQIDPVDSALWNWAQRVAANKVGSGIKADAYAARVYESYGGEFQLYDVLSENQK